MKIKFDYKIVSSDKEAGTIDIEYSCEGFETQIVAIHWPRENEHFRTVIKSYSPIYPWLESQIPLMELSELEDGSVSVNVEDPPKHKD
tara:strand:+ start:136 stop:399 length:264 start_codon:yes stop_codon:yes gene_type:complete